MMNCQPEVNAVARASLVALGVFPPKFKGQSKRSLSMFVIDGKGVIWEDATKLAVERGWRVRIIGIEDGEWGLDLCDGLEPSAIVGALRDAQSQLGGGGSEANPIFKDMALEIIRACLNVSRPFELTDAGLAIVTRKKERLYSLSHAYELAMSVLDPQGALTGVVDAIVAQTTGADAKYIAPLLTSDLWADIKFLRRDLLKSYPKETVGSFLTNVHQMLSGFVTNPAVRSRFGAARGRQVDIDSLWDDRTVTCFRLSPQTGVGETARMVAILTKIRIYNRAGVRQLIDKTIGERAKLTMVMDEYQELATSGIWGEAAVTAWSRSTGLSVVLATQSLSGLYVRIGKDATHALMSNMRTKLVLQTEEPTDVDYFSSLGGHVRRSLVSGKGEYESWHARQLAVNGRIDDFIAPIKLDDVDYSLSTSDIFGTPKKIRLNVTPMVKLDKHSKLSRLKSLSHNAQGPKTMGEKTILDQAAIDASAEYQGEQLELSMLNRQEDQTRAFLSAGNEVRPLWSKNDFMKLGMNQAIVFINKAGVLVTDKIHLDPDLAKMRTKPVNAIEVEAREVKPRAHTGVDIGLLAQSATDSVLARRDDMSARHAERVNAKR